MGMETELFKLIEEFMRDEDMANTEPNLFSFYCWLGNRPKEKLTIEGNGDDLKVTNEDDLSYLNETGGTNKDGRI